MRTEKTMQSEISGYTSNILRKHFGKGPTSVYVTIKKPFITIYFQGFISPMEKVLLKKDEWKRVLEIRDLLVKELEEPILKKLSEVMETEFHELYADWNLENQTGMFVAMSHTKPDPDDFAWPEELDQKKFHQLVAKVTEEAQRKPGHVESYWLSNRTLLVKREEILVAIERALIQEGYTEVLRLVKRPLERQLLQDVQLSRILKQEIQESFLDWDFDTDLGLVVLTLAPSQKTEPDDNSETP